MAYKSNNAYNILHIRNEVAKLNVEINKVKDSQTQLLSDEAIAVIEKLLNDRKEVEIGIKKGKVCIWEIKSKTAYEKVIP